MRAIRKKINCNNILQKLTVLQYVYNYLLYIVHFSHELFQSDKWTFDINGSVYNETLCLGYYLQTGKYLPVLYF